MCEDSEEIIKRIGGRRIPAATGTTQDRDSLVRKANQLKKIYEDTGTVTLRIYSSYNKIAQKIFKPLEKKRISNVRQKMPV